MLRDVGGSTLFIIISVSLLVSLTGCISEKEFTEARLECVDLTSGAFARVPECETQEECFDKLEARVFGYETDSLGFDSQQLLFEFKNHTARSWLYYNRAKTKIDGVREICYTGKSFAALPGKVNELNHELELAFKEADSAGFKSAAFMVNEITDLERERIELVPEEDLFDVYIKFNGNLNALSPNSIGKGDSYFHKTIQKAREFESIKNEFGLDEEILTEFGIEDLVAPLLDSTSRELIKKNRKRIFFLPSLGPVFSSFISYLGAQSDLTLILKKLRSAQSFEFIQIYSEIMGEKESLLDEFSDLVKQDCVSRRFIEVEIEALDARLLKNLGLLEEKTRSAGFEEYSFVDENMFALLYSGSDESPFAYRKYDFESIREFWEKGDARISKLNSNYSAVKSGIQRDSLTKGRQLMDLKALTTESEDLLSALEYIEVDLLQGLQTQCLSKTQETRANLKESEFYPEITYLKTRVETVLLLYSEASTESEKLFYCRKLLFALNELENNKETAEQHRKELLAQIGTCLDELDILMPFVEENNKELHKTITQFKENIEFDFDIDKATGACNQLLNTAKAEARKYINAEEIEKNYSHSIFLFEKLQSISKQSPKLNPSLELDLIQKELNSLAGYFQNNQLKILISINKTQSLNWKIEELNQRMTKKIENSLTAHLISGLKIISIPLESASFGEIYQDYKKIIISNTLTDWDKELSVLFPSTLGLIETKSTPKNIISFSSDKKGITVEFFRVSLGTTTIDVFSEELAEFTENEQVLKANKNSAELEKTITLKTSTKISIIRGKTQVASIDLNYTGLRAYYKNKTIDTRLDGTEIVFFVTNAENRKIVTIYYTAINPIPIEIKLTNTKQIDQNKTIIQYLITTSNQLPHPLKQVNIDLPTQYYSEEIEQILLLNSESEEIPLSLIGQSLVFQTDFAAGQKKDFSHNPKELTQPKNIRTRTQPVNLT